VRICSLRENKKPALASQMKSGHKEKLSFVIAYRFSVLLQIFFCTFAPKSVDKFAYCSLVEFWLHWISYDDAKEIIVCAGGEY